MTAAALALHSPLGTYSEDENMPIMVTGEALRDAVKRQSFIKGGDPDSVEGVKYDFRLGTQILMAGGSPIDTTQLSAIERSKLSIGPGEVVFALSEETLDLPANMFAQLSPKRKISHAGVLTIGGFCVDPGYKGYLLLGLYNFSSTPFKLMPGKKVVAATFHELEERDGKLTGKVPESLMEFPLDLIQTMEKYKPEGSGTFNEAIKALKADLESLRADVNKHDRFEEVLTRHDTQIEKLLSGLTVEADARKSGDDKLSKTVESMDTTLGRFVSVGKWIVGIATAILIAWVSKLLGLI